MYKLGRVSWLVKNVLGGTTGTCVIDDLSLWQSSPTVCHHVEREREIGGREGREGRGGSESADIVVYLACRGIETPPQAI